MAENTMAGLFGASPIDVSSNYINQDAQQALQFANLTPQQQGQYGMFMAGSGLGRLAANTIGNGDPAMVQAQQMQQVKKWIAENNIDLNSPDGLRQAAVYSNQIGAPEGAAFFGRQAMSIEAQQAETGLKKAQAVKALQTPVGDYRERTRAFLSTIEDRLAAGEQVPQGALNQAGLIIQELGKPTQSFDSSSGQMITVPGINPLQNFPNLATSLTSARPTAVPTGGQVSPQSTGASAVGSSTAPNVNVLPGGITTTQVTQPKLDASVRKDIASTDKLITDADSTVAKLEAMAPKIKALDVSLLRNVGRGAEAQLGVSGPDQIVVDEFKSLIEKTRNDILNQANGVQAKDDAERIMNEVMGDPTIWRNPARLQAAYTRLTTMVAGNAEALRTKRGTLVPEGANVGNAPAAPKKEQKPTTSRETAFASMKAANPTASNDKINKWLDTQGY